MKNEMAAESGLRTIIKQRSAVFAAVAGRFARNTDTDFDRATLQPNPSQD